MPDLDAHVTLRMQGRSCDSYGLAGDTYGVVLMQTQETDARTGRPRMEVVLEERKGTEDPKIEFITAPWEHGATALQRLKRYVNAVLDLTANGTVAQWATAASVQCPGASVWWGGRGGSPGTPTGKPVSPRLLNNRPTMVAEVRQTGHAFSKTYWGNIRA